MGEEAIKLASSWEYFFSASIGSKDRSGFKFMFPCMMLTGGSSMVFCQLNSLFCCISCLACFFLPVNFLYVGNREKAGFYLDRHNGIALSFFVLSFIAGGIEC
ncbi:MAG: hypothetical protein D3922_11230 [Candidatus Electrothrix sp. AR1]|nr:hypothetical protein [Candidatus Electrothrix sp. AR1]